MNNEKNEKNETAGQIAKASGERAGYDVDERTGAKVIDSIVLRGDLSGLPPCLIIASKNEVLQHDSQELQARLRAQGGHAEYLEWARTPHAFPVLARHLPEGRAALDKTAAFIRQQLLHSPG